MHCNISRVWQMSGSGITAPKLLLHDMIRSLLVRAVTQEQQYSFFRYSEFSSQKLGITAKDTRLCSSSGQASDSQCFLFALWWRRLPVGRRNNRQKGLRGAKAEGDACKQCIHGNVSSPQLKTERGLHRRNGEIWRAMLWSITCHCLSKTGRFTSRFCLMLKNTCSLGLYLWQQHAQ